MTNRAMNAGELAAALQKLPADTLITFVDSGYDDDYSSSFYEWSVSLVGSRICLVEIVDSGAFDDYGDD